MHCHYGRRDPVPVLPEWLTSYIGVSKELKTNADLPKKRVQFRQSDIHLNTAGMWLWMANLLQFWTDLSGPWLYGSVFCYPSVLSQQFTADINPGWIGCSWRLRHLEHQRKYYSAYTQDFTTRCCRWTRQHPGLYELLSRTLWTVHMLSYLRSKWYEV